MSREGTEKLWFRVKTKTASLLPAKGTSPRQALESAPRAPTEANRISNLQEHQKGQTPDANGMGYTDRNDNQGKKRLQDEKADRSKELSQQRNKRQA